MKLQARRALVAGSLALAVATAAGCSSGGSVNGSDAGTDAGKDGGKLRPVSVGIFTPTGKVAFEMGTEQGFFADEGLKVSTVMGAGGAAHLPALASGKIQFMISSPITPLQAATQGLDVKVVSNYSRNDPAKPDDSTVIAVGPGSSIKSAKDLEGTTVSVNAVGAVGDLSVKEEVARAGGDPEKVKFVQLSLGDMPAALASGKIDAGMTGQPWLRDVLKGGGSILLDFIKDLELGGSELVVVGSGKLSDDEIEGFVTALQKTDDYIAAHDDEYRAALATALQIPPAAAKALVFGTSTTELDMSALQHFADLMAKYKVVDSKPDLDEVVWSDAPKG